VFPQEAGTVVKHQANVHGLWSDLGVVFTRLQKEEHALQVAQEFQNIWNM